MTIGGFLSVTTDKNETEPMCSFILWDLETHKVTFPTPDETWGFGYFRVYNETYRAKVHRTDSFIIGYLSSFSNQYGVIDLRTDPLRLTPLQRRIPDELGEVALLKNGKFVFDPFQENIQVWSSNHGEEYKCESTIPAFEGEMVNYADQSWPCKHYEGLPVDKHLLTLSDGRLAIQARPYYDSCDHVLSSFQIRSEDGSTCIKDFGQHFGRFIGIAEVRQKVILSGRARNEFALIDLKTLAVRYTAHSDRELTAIKSTPEGAIIQFDNTKVFHINNNSNKTFSSDLYTTFQEMRVNLAPGICSLISSYVFSEIDAKKQELKEDFVPEKDYPKAMELDEAKDALIPLPNFPQPMEMEEMKSIPYRQNSVSDIIKSLSMLQIESDETQASLQDVIKGLSTFEFKADAKPCTAETKKEGVSNQQDSSVTLSMHSYFADIPESLSLSTSRKRKRVEEASTPPDGQRRRH